MQDRVVPVEDVHFLVSGVRGGGNVDEFADAVAGMHHQITGIDVFQGCLRACLARLVFPAGAAARRSGLVPAEQFRGREDGRFRFRDAEPCRKFSAKRGDGQQSGRSGADVPEAFFLPFIGEEHADIPFPVQPFPDLAFRQFTAHFLHHEVPRLKAAQGIVMDGKGEVFFPRRIFRGRGEDAYVPPFLAERGGNNQVARFDPVPQGFRALGFRQYEVDVFRLAEGNLGIHIKFPDGFNFVVKKLQAHGVGGLERKDIQDAAASGPLPAGNDLWNTFKSRFPKLPYQVVRCVRLPRFQGDPLVLHAVGGRNLIVQAAFR